MTALIVAFHRDPAQWTALRGALNDLVDADVIVVDSISATLDVIDARTPDLILVDPLISPRDEDNLTGYLALLPEASHVQTISVPVISPCSGDDNGALEAPSQQAWFRRRLLPNRRSRLTTTVAGWKPEAFAAEVASYLSLSLALKADKAQRDGAREFRRTVERRQASRWSAEQAYLALPFMTTDRADLVNISTTGLLVRTDIRPTPRLSDQPEGYSRTQSPLTLLSPSGEKIRWTGTPVRCRAKSLGDGRFLYDVAFRFDEPLDLQLANIEDAQLWPRDLIPYGGSIAR